uniref:Uncharacterized protein n=1 Tax=Ditylenchus dipsaci TaxID=166011 RepID=A0A915EBP1_9BILA
MKTPKRSHMALGQVNKMTMENHVSAYSASFKITFEPQAQIHAVMWRSSILHKDQLSETELCEKIILRDPALTKHSYNCHQNRLALEFLGV